MASHAFTIRLRRTCWSCTRSVMAEGKVAGRESRDGDTARNEIAAGKAEQFFETLVHAHGLERDLAAAQHGAQALDDLAGAAVLADDVREDAAKLDEVGRVLRHEALARLCVAEDAAERLAQLVCEGTRERAQRRPRGKDAPASSRCSCASASACFCRVMSIETPSTSRRCSQLPAARGCGRARRSIAPSHRAGRCDTRPHRNRQSPALAGSRSRARRDRRDGRVRARLA